MSIKKKGLGKGLDSLIPDNKSIKSVTPDKSAEAKKEAEEKAGVQTMKINEVEPNRDQPRKNFDEDADRKSTRLNSSHVKRSRMPSSA